MGEVNPTDANPYSCDIFIQEFFIFIYKILNGDQRDLYDDIEEGISYYKAEKVE